jgi:coproporphyrinogen III oxidase-like Fe-S oxidoreductase
MIPTVLKSALFRSFAGMACPPPLTSDTLPSFTGLQEVGLYLHVPFCKSLCPFCPYNRVRHSADLYELFEEALYRELDRYSQILAGCRVNSLYVGGGTPTVNAEGLLRMITRVRRAFPGEYPIAVEVHPLAAERAVLSSLRAAGVSQASVGVQSLVDRELKGIGRNHDAEVALEALRNSLGAGFTVNADLMFALGDQDDASWQQTVTKTLEMGVHEISTYPMFSFPYAQPTNGFHATPRRAPEKTLRRRLEIARLAAENMGFERSTVWSWTRPKAPRFSSVTRHRYVGLGPGAASMIGSSFYLNTFSVTQYASAVESRLPVALATRVLPRLDRAYWLYWSLYALWVSRSDFASKFDGHDLEREFGRLLRPMQILGWLAERSDGYAVTNSGAYWIHRLQNAYSLHYLERLWGTCANEAWPKEVQL